ncbi:hypothetical protein Tsubulata_048525, partial [Turnera subulata]
MIVVAAWVCLTLVVGSGAVRVGPSRVEEEGDQEYPYPLPYHKYSAFQTVEFSIDYETSTDDYKANLIDVMRDRLKYGDGFFGIPSLPSTKVSGLNRFGLVKLNYDNGQSVVGGGLCKVQVAAVVVAAWVCLTLVVGSGAVRVGPSKVEEEGEEYPYPAHHKYSAFKTVEFSIDYDTSAADYKEKLIDVMRDQLKYGDGFFGIPSLPSTKVSGLDRFGLVKLNYDDNGQSQVQNRHNRKRPTTTLMGTQHTRMQNSFL